jgi:CRISPR/Cas system endoribonuclease Cas6 (RAMP superfamily)
MRRYVLGSVRVNSICKSTATSEIINRRSRFIVRVKLTLTSRKRTAHLPLDYQFALASLIYSPLGDASAAFAAMLHDEGFRVEQRTFKLFTFSRIRPQRGRVIKDHLLLEEPRLSFQMNSSVSDFIDHFSRPSRRRPAKKE